MSKLTEAEVLRLLRDKHTKSGNGGSGEYAFLTHVRNDAAFNANRSFDAVVLNLWPSRGLALEVFEVKVSRSDWQRELAKPEKAEDACTFADKFWIVAPTGCVKPEELPPTWGLIEVTGDGDKKPWKLRTATAAPWIGPPTTGQAARPPLPRGLVVGLLRSAPGAVPGGKVRTAAEEELARAREEGRLAGIAEADRRHDIDRRFERDPAIRLQNLRDALINAGVPRFEADPDAVARNATLYAEAITGRRILTQLSGVKDGIRRVLADLEAATEERTDA